MPVGTFGRSPLVFAVLAQDGKTVCGAGFLVRRNHILTCAHVIRDAGWSSGSTVSVQVAGSDLAPIILASVLIITETSDESQRVGESDGGDSATNDLCLLQLPEAAAGFNPDTYPLVDRANLLKVAVTAFGFPGGSQEAGSRISAITYGGDRRGLVFLERQGSDEFIAPGFSGAPVIADAGSEVLGMVVRMQRNGRRAFMMPLLLADRIIREHDPTLALTLKGAVERDHEHVPTLREFAGRYFSTFSNEDTFTVEAAFCESYAKVTEIHRGGQTETVGLSQVALLEDRRSGRVYLQAPGGFGKTSYLMHLMLTAIDAGRVPFYLDAREASALPGRGDEDDLRALFGACAQAGGSYEVFRRTHSESPHECLVIVDGLNENLVAPEQLIKAVDYLSRNYARVSVFVADRMARKRQLPKGFELATVLPVNLEAISNAEARQLVSKVRSEKFRRVLSIPFFLDLYVKIIRRSTLEKGIEGVRGRVGMLRAYFEKYLETDTQSEIQVGRAGTVNALGPVAFNAYRIRGLRMAKAWWEEQLTAIDATLAARLSGSGIMVEEDDGAVVFRHQLLHDFLVGLHLSGLDATSWRSRVFDVATLGGKSFEALEFASELLGERADEFIVEVYDWNYSGAVDCVRNLETGASGLESPLSPALKDAMLAIAAEKRFDPFQHTRDRANEKAVEFVSAFGIDYKGPTKFEELAAEVRTKYPPQPGDRAGILGRWLEVFLSTSPPPAKDWALLQESPLLAWTAANVFRRTAAGDTAFVSYLLGLFAALRRAQRTDERALATRWRIVHILGTSGTPEAVEVLAAAANDQDEGQWVRYGAVRSLAEVASRRRTADEARAVLDGIIRAMPTLRDTEAFREVRDVARLPELTRPPWWKQEYRRVLERGLELAGADVQEVEAWKARIRDLEND